MMAVGNQLCLSGISTVFYTTDPFFEEAVAEKASCRYPKLLKKPAGVNVLILDEFAPRNYTHDEANTLLDIVEGAVHQGHHNHNIPGIVG